MTLPLPATKPSPAVFGLTVADAIAFSNHADKILVAVRISHGMVVTYITLPPGVFRDAVDGLKRSEQLPSEYRAVTRELSIGSYEAITLAERTKGFI